MVTRSNILAIHQARDEARIADVSILQPDGAVVEVSIDLLQALALLNDLARLALVWVNRRK